MCRSCSISVEPILEPQRKLGAAGLFLGTVALEGQPLGVVLVPNLPKLCVVLGDLLGRLADEELERLADVLLLDRQLPGAAVGDLAEVGWRDFFQRPFDGVVFVRRRLANFAWHIRLGFRCLQVEQGIGLALAEPARRQVDGEKPLADRMAPTIFNAALEEPEDGRLRGIGVVEDGPLTQATSRNPEEHARPRPRTTGALDR